MCDYSADAVTYYGPEVGVNHLVCVDERCIDGYHNPLCGSAVDAGFGCIRWEDQ